MITSKYFKEDEFNRCSPSCSLQDETNNYSKLDTAGSGGDTIRADLGLSFPDMTDQGRSDRAHTIGRAIDIV
ncbi:MAG: hypothetical protein ACLU4J_03490 [Butyricimonas paravirosa]